MKLSAKELQGIVDLLAKLAGEIGTIEQAYGLLFGGGDFRPRIEYFHDAVRAFTAGHPKDRLTVERLAYDVAALRYLQSKPLASLTTEVKSPSTTVAKRDAKMPAKPAMDRDTRLHLSELYQRYGVLFAALLKPTADRDFLDRQEALNTQYDYEPDATIDVELKRIDKAHGDYAMAQLALYESGKDVVKQLASEGLNLAGQFVQDAMAQVNRGVRGR